MKRATAYGTYDVIDRVDIEKGRLPFLFLSLIWIKFAI